ncbi:type II secretion system F family protein [Planctellipticum variicoloris]|uniref:type II secretion system F family protein n=1 Tax=Planctellipticum variicoloris TaxID=3064265 RepID=UPI002C6E7CBC|nr:type II secretion system F family protein [Planctomycetaceae bacterium SH412]HTN04423.1 type II secretion system F family protein [Planctomycetaceae bacterium]
MPLILSLMFGAAIVLLVWAGEGAFGRFLDFVEADFRAQLRRLRASPRHVRPGLLSWWIFVLALFLVLWFVFNIPILGLAICGVLFLAPWYFVRRWAHLRRQLIDDQMADAMVSLASAIRAGLSLPQSLEILANQSPRPISQEFQQIVGEYQMGKTMEKCLDEARERLRSENFALFAAAMQASRSSGGRLNETVERIAVSVREMQRLERKIQADTSQARTSAFYMALVPIAILAIYYFVVDPESTARLFTSVLGQIFLCTSLVLNLVAYLWARQILNPDI